MESRKNRIRSGAKKKQQSPETRKRNETASTVSGRRRGRELSRENSGRSAAGGKLVEIRTSARGTSTQNISIQTGQGRGQDIYDI